MGIKQRKLREKELTRTEILNAAMQLVREQGWQELSMRKIAERIEYSAPVIYEFFPGKEALLLELTRIGYTRLSAQVTQAMEKQSDPWGRWESLWLAYWKFAFLEKELYQLMFGVSMHCCPGTAAIVQAKDFEEVARACLRKLIRSDDPMDAFVTVRYYGCWALAHGFISLYLVRKRMPEPASRDLLISLLCDPAVAEREDAVYNEDPAPDPPDPDPDPPDPPCGGV